MTTEEAVSFYKTQQGLAAALGIGQPTISGWGTYPPPLRQIQIERITRGKLKAESNVFRSKRRAA